MSFANPRIETLLPKNLIGLHLRMSLSENRTVLLWKNFMPRRQEIIHKINSYLYAVQCYPMGYFDQFVSNAKFEKWAAVEVDKKAPVPEGMELLILAGGLYAVFQYKGLSTDPSIFQFIFTTWLPESDYVLDDRPHFELLGDKYKNNDPESEEEIWIPIKTK